MSWWGYRPYVPVAERRAKAMRKVQKLAKKGQKFLPIQIVGRTITTTFWGKAWCDNLASYSDFASRLPRGRTYVRNGSVLDLQVEPGQVTSLVCGSELYRIKITIKPLGKSKWKGIKTRCGQQIGSLVELLQGSLSKNVMEIVTAHEDGLFPAPEEIEMSCSCPDWADMCKHVAATLYGVGSRLDRQPELLFTLRQINHLELITQSSMPMIKGIAGKKKTIKTSDLADVFGIEFDETPLSEKAQPSTVSRRSNEISPNLDKVSSPFSLRKKSKPSKRSLQNERNSPSRSPVTD